MNILPKINYEAIDEVVKKVEYPDQRFHDE